MVKLSFSQQNIVYTYCAKTTLVKLILTMFGALLSSDFVLVVAPTRKPFTVKNRTIVIVKINITSTQAVEYCKQKGIAFVISEILSVL